jgi:hypothetical protein
MAQPKTVTLEVEATDRGYVSEINHWRAARDHDRAVRQGLLFPPGHQLTPLERLLLEINNPMTTDKDRGERLSWQCLIAMHQRLTPRHISILATFAPPSKCWLRNAIS